MVKVLRKKTVNIIYWHTESHAKTAPQPGRRGEENFKIRV